MNTDRTGLSERASAFLTMIALMAKANDGIVFQDATLNDSRVQSFKVKDDEVRYMLRHGYIVRGAGGRLYVTPEEWMRQRIEEQIEQTGGAPTIEEVKGWREE